MLAGLGEGEDAKRTCPELTLQCAYCTVHLASTLDLSGAVVREEAAGAVLVHDAGTCVTTRRLPGARRLGALSPRR